jgi:hypothetical protein
MTSKTTASVISLVEAADDSEPTVFEQEAIDRARSMFQRVSDLKWFYHDVAPDQDGDGPAVVPFSSAAGRRRIQTQLSRTAKRRTKQLRTVIEHTEDTSLDEAAESYEVHRACRQLGTYYHPSTTHLFDGTRWSFGSPILSEDRVAEIEDNHNPSHLAVVDVKLRY